MKKSFTSTNQIKQREREKNFTFRRSQFVSPPMLPFSQREVKGQSEFNKQIPQCLPCKERNSRRNNPSLVGATIVATLIQRPELREEAYVLLHYQCPLLKEKKELRSRSRDDVTSAHASRPVIRTTNFFG
jgi:hypothetical protein